MSKICLYYSELSRDYYLTIRSTDTTQPTETSQAIRLGGFIKKYLKQHCWNTHERNGLLVVRTGIKTGIKHGNKKCNTSEIDNNPVKRLVRRRKTACSRLNISLSDQAKRIT